MCTWSMLWSRCAARKMHTSKSLYPRKVAQCIVPGKCSVEPCRKNASRPPRLPNIRHSHSKGRYARARYVHGFTYELVHHIVHKYRGRIFGIVDSEDTGQRTLDIHAPHGDVRLENEYDLEVAWAGKFPFVEAHAFQRPPAERNTSVFRSLQCWTLTRSFSPYLWASSSSPPTPPNIRVSRRRLTARIDSKYLFLFLGSTWAYP